MKKTLLYAFFGLAGCFSMQAQQTKQLVSAMSASSPAFEQTNTYALHTVQPVFTPLAISGYYQQGFEGTTFPPTGWMVQNVAGATYTWARSTAQAHASTAAAFIRYDASGGQDWLIAPRYTVTATTDSIVFWMRLAFAGYAPDSLSLKVSTTDSLPASFTTTILGLREGTNYPPNATTWYRYAISLQAYVGQQIYLAFKHYNADGDGLYIDDVAIGTKPAAEIATTALISPSLNIGSGAVTPQASFTNLGTAMQSFNVTTDITPGGYTSTFTVSNLASGASTNATFAPWTATPGTYTLKVYSQLAGDANTANDTITRTITVLSNFNNYGWENMNVLPAGRWATSPVFTKNCIASTDTGYVYLISGGDASFANTALNTRFNTVTGTYTDLAAIPQSRTQITPLHVNGKIYVIGGYSGSFAPVTTNSIYDVAANTWTTGAPMPTAVGDYAAAVYNDSLIYYIGGYSGSADVNLVQIYDTYTNTWTSGTAKTGTATAGGRMGISGNQIVYVGGYSQTLAATQSAAVLGTINAAAPATITWSALPASPVGATGRFGAATLLEDNGLIYFAGGDPDGAGTSTLNKVFAYNTISSTWELGPDMPLGVSNINGLAAAVYNDSLYLVTMGGYTGSVIATSNSWINLGPAASAPYAETDFAVCINNTPATIHAYNGVSYAWSPAGSLDNAAAAAPVSSASVTTTYTVVIAKAYGCSVTDSIQLTINDLPVVMANASNDTLCAGMMTTLSGSGATSYAWTGSVTDNVAFAPAATDSYTVTGTDANSCENTDTIEVVVNVLPVVMASASNDTLCAGMMTTLSGSGAVSYAWTGSVTDNIAFAPAATDSYTVTGTDANGCENTDTIEVVVNVLPAVMASASNDTLCAGMMTTLSGSGATSYAWTGSVSDNVAFAPAATDSYTVTGTDANGCQNTDTIEVVVNTLPVVTLSLSQTTACVNNAAFTLSGESPAGGTWSGTAVTGNSFDPAAAGTGTFGIIYSYTDGNGCSATASDSITVDPCIGLKTAKASPAVSVYPNPTTGWITVSCNGAAPERISVINVLGETIRTIVPDSASIRISLQDQPDMVYYITVQYKDASKVLKVVKQ